MAWQETTSLPRSSSNNGLNLSSTDDPISLKQKRIGMMSNPAWRHSLRRLAGFDETPYGLPELCEEPLARSGEMSFEGWKSLTPEPHRAFQQKLEPFEKH